MNGVDGPQRWWSIEDISQSSKRYHDKLKNDLKGNNDTEVSEILNSRNEIDSIFYPPLLLKIFFKIFYSKKWSAITSNINQINELKESIQRFNDVKQKLESKYKISKLALPSPDVNLSETDIKDLNFSHLYNVFKDERMQDVVEYWYDANKRIAEGEAVKNLHVKLKDPTASIEERFETFNALPKKYRDFLSHSVWQAHHKPLGDPNYGENRIRENPLLLLEIYSHEGIKILDATENYLKNRRDLSWDCMNLAWMDVVLEHQGIDDALLMDNKLTDETTLKLFNDVEPKESLTSERIQETILQLMDANNAMKFKPLDQKMKGAKSPISVGVKIPENQLPFKGLRVMHVAAEFSGLIKQGGLAEAVYGLVSEQAKDPNNKVRLVFPKYDHLPKALDLKEKPKYQLTDPLTKKTCKVFRATLENGLKVYFLDDELFKINGDPENSTKSIYGNSALVDRRFLQFSNLAETFVQKYETSKKTKDKGNGIDVLHAHDWHAGLVPTLLKQRNPESWASKNSPATVFTFHNNNYCAQGIVKQDDIDAVFPPEQRAESRSILSIGIGAMKAVGRAVIGAKEPHRMKFASKNGGNVLLQGLLDSDAVTTVSKKFAEEAQTEHLGFGLDSDVRLAARQGKLFGIQNGNNISSWDPKNDAQLQGWKDPETEEDIDLRFGADDDDLFGKKDAIKKQLVKWTGEHRTNVALDTNKPWVVFVGRYDSSQKGIDKFETVIEETLERGGQFIAMGSQEDEEATRLLDAIEARWKGKPGVFIIRDKKVNGRYEVQQGTDDIPGIGSLVRGAADFTLVPSEFEPCGLVQYEGWQFGTMAIGTNTGGIADSVVTNGSRTNGFLFDRHKDWKSEEQKNLVRRTVRQALTGYKWLSKTRLSSRIKAVMQDENLKLGWSQAAREYRKVYEKALQKQRIKDGQYIELPF